MIWMTYDPDNGWEEHATEAAARSAFDSSVARARESTGVPDHADTIGMYRVEPVATVRVLTSDGSPAQDGYPLETASLDIVMHDATRSPGEFADEDLAKMVVCAPMLGEPAAEIVHGLAAFARQLLTERDALRATVGRLRPVVEALADGWRLLPDEVQDRIERVITTTRNPHRDFSRQTLRALLSGGPSAPIADTWALLTAARAARGDQSIYVRWTSDGYVCQSALHGEVFGRGSTEDGALRALLADAPAEVPDVG